MHKRNTWVWGFLGVAIWIALVLGACSPAEIPVQESGPEGTALLIFPYTKFSVTDGTGRTLACTGGELEGDLVPLSQQVVPRGSAPAELQLTVSASGSFTYRTQAEDADFSATFADFTGGASGSGVQEVLITADGSVTATGQAMQYRIGLMPGQGDYAYCSVEGAGDGTVALRRGRQGLELQGAAGACTLVVLGTDGQELKPIVLPLSGELVTLELTEQEGTPILRVHHEAGTEEFPLTEPQSAAKE